MPGLRVQTGPGGDRPADYDRTEPNCHEKRGAGGTEYGGLAGDGGTGPGLESSAAVVKVAPSISYGTLAETYDGPVMAAIGPGRCFGAAGRP